MAKDWKVLTDDELLNFDGSQTNLIAQYERIMRKKTNDALMDVQVGLHDLKKTIHVASEKLEAQLGAVEKAERETARSQSKLQKAALWLTLVIAGATVMYTYITWQSVQTMREANEIQREGVKLQKSASERTASKNE